MTRRRLPHLYSGKVRDIYDAGDDRLLMVTSDRLSAFDVVHGRADPGQGPGAHRHVGVLVRAARRRRRQPPHLDRPRRPAPPAPSDPELAGRIMLCRRAEMLPIECIVRGYLTGSAWKEYRTERHHARPGRCPAGLLESRPAARAGVHAVDQGRATATTTRTSPSSEAVDLVGAELAEQARDVSLELYRAGRRAGPPSAGSSSPTPSSSSGLVDGELVLADEVLTPDSSPLLAGRRVGARHHAAVVRQAAGARLPRGPRLGQEPPPPPLPAEVVRGHARALHRGLRAHHRPLVRRLARRGLSRRRARPERPRRLGAHALLGARRDPPATRASPTRRAPRSSGRCRTLGFDGIRGVRVARHPLRSSRPPTRRAPGPRRRGRASGSSPTR